MRNFAVAKELEAEKSSQTTANRPLFSATIVSTLWLPAVTVGTVISEPILTPDWVKTAQQLTADRSAGGPRLGLAVFYRCVYSALTMHSTGHTVTHFGES